MTVAPLDGKKAPKKKRKVETLNQMSTVSLNSPVMELDQVDELSDESHNSEYGDKIAEFADEGSDRTNPETYDASSDDSDEYDGPDNDDENRGAVRRTSGLDQSGTVIRGSNSPSQAQVDSLYGSE